MTSIKKILNHKYLTKKHMIQDILITTSRSAGTSGPLDVRSKILSILVNRTNAPIFNISSNGNVEAFLSLFNYIPASVIIDSGSTNEVDLRGQNTTRGIFILRSMYDLGIFGEESLSNRVFGVINITFPIPTGRITKHIVKVQAAIEHTVVIIKMTYKSAMPYLNSTSTGGTRRGALIYKPSTGKMSLYTNGLPPKGVLYLQQIQHVFITFDDKIYKLRFISTKFLSGSPFTYLIDEVPDITIEVTNKFRNGILANRTLFFITPNSFYGSSGLTIDKSIQTPPYFNYAG